MEILKTYHAFVCEQWQTMKWELKAAIVFNFVIAAVHLIALFIQLAGDPELAAIVRVSTAIPVLSAAVITAILINPYVNK